MSLNKPYRVIISGGGTGGHIYPAIAIANALKAADRRTEILFVGAEGRMEMQKVPAAGYKITGLWISGIQRRLTADNLAFPFKVISSLMKSSRIIHEFKPDIAIGVGGYASFPLLYTASLKGIPTVIQEQNSYAGVANKFLSKKARKVCVAYENMNAFFPQEKVVLTGNPVRKDILEYSSKRQQALAHFGLKDEVKTLFVMGGSLGARTINESIASGIDRLVKEGIQLIWQTGKGYIDKAKELAESLKSDKIKVFEFVYEMDLAYAASDVVVSRAGALSISELCLVGKPSILVPSPNVAEDHQTKNAMALVRDNAAMMIKDQEARGCLVEEALKLMSDSQRQDMYRKNILKLGRPHAADDIAKIVIDIINNK